MLNTIPNNQDVVGMDDYEVDFTVSMENKKEDTEMAITFKEPDDNTDYSYIINPSALASYDIAAERLQNIPDEINRYLQKQNIKGAKLKIGSVKKKGTILCFEVEVLEHDLMLNMEYNERIGTISIK